MLPLLPLLPSRLDVPLAFRQGRLLSRRDFLLAVQVLAARLPGTGPVLNLCADRYLFAVAFCAAICRGRVSLLPNSTAPASIAALQAEHPDLLCLGDTAQPPFAQMPYLQVVEQALSADADVAMPHIPADQLVAHVFTSGSTGQPVAHAKTFGSLQRSACAEAERLWPLLGIAPGAACAVVGTVPFQHMYGLESTVLLPLFGGGLLTSARPFFPADVVAALADAPAPRLLVTTPFHLRSLLDAGLTDELRCPPLAGVLSATAPLSAELAARAEARLGVPLVEIYGATETGMLAVRRPQQDSDWETLPGIRLRDHDGVVRVDGGHLDAEQALGDVIELLGPTRFRLLGRSADMVNIAGKRNSLAYLNQVAARLPGVRDVAFCLPADDCADGEAVGRLTAFVVAPGKTAAELLAALRPLLDPVFLPRPLVLLDALPRNDTGKLPAAALAGLIAQHVKRAH